jgi:nicotinamide/nicotinate riboside kinase
MITTTAAAAATSNARAVAQKQKKRPFLIGLSGSSCSGKTTLSRLIREYVEQVCHMRCLHVNMDDFYRPRDRANMPYVAELDSLNFDTIRSLDLLKFHAHLSGLLSAGSKSEATIADYIVLDGFLLYEDDFVFRMLDKRYFLYLPKEECARRRGKREYALAVRPGYFDVCVWGEYLKYKEKCERANNNDDDTTASITFLNGEDPVEANLRFILKDLNLL